MPNSNNPSSSTVLFSDAAISTDNGFSLAAAICLGALTGVACSALNNNQQPAPSVKDMAKRALIFGFMGFVAPVDIITSEEKRLVPKAEVVGFFAGFSLGQHVFDLRNDNGIRKIEMQNAAPTKHERPRQDA